MESPGGPGGHRRHCSRDDPVGVNFVFVIFGRAARSTKEQTLLLLLLLEVGRDDVHCSARVLRTVPASKYKEIESESDRERKRERENAGQKKKKRVKSRSPLSLGGKKSQSSRTIPENQNSHRPQGNDMSDSGDEINEQEEADALGRIAHAIACYRSDASGEISRWEASAARLASRSSSSNSTADRTLAALLSRLRTKHLAARAAAERNARWLDYLLETTVGFSREEEERGRKEQTEGEENNSGCSPYAPAAAALARSLVSSGALPSAGDADKVRYVLKNAARDWSDSGKAERDASYGRIVEALLKALPPGRGSAVEESAEEEDEERREKEDRETSPPRVLVPGSGLGRLCVDLVQAGYAAQGNEFSYYMLLASAFALNFCCGAFGGSGGEEEEEEENGGENGGDDGKTRGRGRDAEEGDGEDAETEPPTKDLRPVIHPWVLTPCNWLRDADQLAGVRVPDIDPAGVVAEAEEKRRRGRSFSSSASGRPSPHSRSSSSGEHDHYHRHCFPLLSMVAGDFAQVYSHPSRESSFDAVATCFFLDTAHNVLDYVKAIKHVLVKDGTGTWVNLGPLLYHWADAASYLPSAEVQETPSIELPLEEVLLAVVAAGFKIVDLKTNVPATFNATPRSMLRSGYACAQWTAVLKREEEGEVEGAEAAKNKE